MPSTLHEGLICLFRADPQLVVDLVAHGYGLRLTPTPGMLLDRHADLAVDADRHLRVNARCVDLVLVCEDPSHPEGGAVIALEVQLDVDRDKRQRITTYLALLADRHKLPVHLVIVALRDRVARDLATWRLGTALEVHSFILDRHLVPSGIDLEAGHQRPSLAIYAGAMLGFHGDLEAARVGLEVALAQPQPDRQRYAATILAALTQPRRAIFLGALPMYIQRELSQLERESGTFLTGLEEGLTRGREQGRRATLAEAVLALLEARGLPVSDAQAARLRDAELETLERCFDAARRIERAAELFADH